MRKIQFSNHLLSRLLLRKISKTIVKQCISHPESLFTDTLNNSFVAIKWYGNKCFMVAYVEDEDKITAITIHPIKSEQINNRVKSGRWIINSKN